MQKCRRRALPLLLSIKIVTRSVPHKMENLLSLRRGPTTGKLPELTLVLRPVVQSCWIEVRPVGPRQSLGVGINSDLLKEFKVAQRPVQFALENRLKVDGLLRGVIKTNTKRIRRYDFESPDSMNSELHRM